MSTESTEPTSRRRVAQAANLFDLRRIIGGLFTVWGVLLLILGVTDSTTEANKAAGLNINLIAGAGMLVFGVLFLIWAFSRPLGTQLVESEAGEGEHPGRAAPRGVDAAALSGSDQSRRGPRRDRDRSGGQGGAGA